ncbi:E3 ubiquitin-protein ligase SINA-like 10 isoform X1 [Homalodisca vitripennis]|uniref:E3 ubiquitin-protein ligase SINA-like 10 isoform X1 n=1 Tax=Homalodisca vitripennis TaxID=197043 RepID=UPI001EE9C6CC|nr:E3 ubiquitin-protein ligase SINA-like 10 isoform X1 [Homalodisca vitripennis]
MLDRIKQWTLRVLDWGNTEAEGGCREEALESALRSLQECRLDPRELPRPHRHDTCGKYCSAGESDEEVQGMDCSCRNCAHLSSQLLECAICLEPLAAPQNRGVTSCLQCGNIACLACASRLPRCPYCRTDHGLAPNIALQRLIYKLDIPCRKNMLPVRCPHRKCEWRGDINSLAAHLEHMHLVTILNGNSVTLDIAEFQRKAQLSESRSRHYSVLLSCYSDVFVCKVVLYHGKLKVVLSQLTRTRHLRLAAWVELSCISKTVQGIIPLSKNKSDIEVPVSNFLPPATGSGDRVSISINIRPFNS